MYRFPCRFSHRLSLVLIFAMACAVWSKPQTLTPGDDPQSADANKQRLGSFDGPLDDFVPCMFDSSQEARNRTIKPLPSTPSGPIGLEKAKTLINAVEDGLNERLSALKDNYALTESFIDAVKKAFEQRVKPEHLAPMPLPDPIAELYEAAFVVAESSPLTSTTSNGNSTAGKAALRTELNSEVQSVSKKALKQPYPTPPDISCSMAILSWQETSDVFGRR